MIHEHRRRKRLGVVVVGAVIVAGLAGCTKPNPRSCADGICTDQAFPFCDVDGALDGTPGACIGVECTATEFEACRGDKAITCNAAGNDYELVQCELGCDAATGGCRLCEPNQTACTNGKVATCDASGNIVASETCALGCFEDEPRCRTINPSNNLATFLDMVVNPPDVDLANAVFKVDTGQVLVGGQPVTVPNFRAAASGNGVSIRVFVANSFKLTSATIELDGDPRDLAGSGIAFVAHKDIVIAGELLVDPRAGSAVAGCVPAGLGDGRDEGSGRAIASGGGGGANATDGGEGGTVMDRLSGGIKDLASGTVGLVPLRGGCSGGYAARTVTGTFANGGGAVQLSSGTKLEVDATIDVRGRVGILEPLDQTNAFLIGGGGAGGSILLEAPTVVLGPTAKLLATGGDGAQGCTMPTTYCGTRGTGATPMSAATRGADVPYTTAVNTSIMAGGGGGGLGRIRINTPDQTYTTSSSTVEAGAVSTGSLSTR